LNNSLDNILNIAHPNIPSDHFYGCLGIFAFKRRTLLLSESGIGMEKYILSEINDRIYDFFGVHLLHHQNNKYKYIFRVADINAKRIELIGDFISEPIALNKASNNEIWETSYESDIPLEGMRYKYKVFTESEIIIRTDPFSLYSDNDQASIIVSYEAFANKGSSEFCLYDRDTPMNIFVLDLESFCYSHRFSSQAYVNYREIMEKIIEHLNYMSYTHLEIIGTITSGSFCLDSNFGSIDDFISFVDGIHKNGNGIILDIHFKQNTENLFSYESEEFRSFVISTVMYWLREFNIDGIKLELKELKLYGSENYVLKLLECLNKKIYYEKPNAFLIADDHLLESELTVPLYKGGIGLSLKINRGWLLDMIDYMRSDSDERKKEQNFLTFPLNHACVENFVLPLTEKISEIACVSDVLPNIKLFLAVMMLQQGKKRVFESNFINSEEIINYRHYLNRFYLENEALWKLDNDKKGFKWVTNDRDRDSIIVQGYS